MAYIPYLTKEEVKWIDSWVVFWAFLATIPAANWLIGNWGTCVQPGLCLIPVWPGILAPSGVIMIGLALVLRDAVHHMLGVRWVVIAILLGAGLSALFASPALALASGIAFLISETADLFVYAPLRKHHLYKAVGLSSLVGALVDSVLFLLLAFGSLNFLAGQFIGKMWAALFALILMKLYALLCRPTSSV
jgi:uncharacterized PurR-regulated membrane protein YhhQ (DUF165 family)